MIELYEFQRQLRELARKADRVGLSRQGILEEIVAMAEDYLEKAEAIELEMIVQLQRDEACAT